MNKGSIKWLNVVIILLAICIYQGAALGRTTDTNEKLLKSINSMNVNTQMKVVTTSAITAASVSDTGTNDMRASSDEGRENSDERLFMDGTFAGSGNGFGGKIKVKVTIKNDRITDIQVTDHRGEGEAYYSQASVLVDEIIAQQSTDIDTVSGATFSSNGILMAVNDALKKAQK